MLNTVHEGEVPSAKGSSIRVGTLDAELEPLILSKAAQHGLDPSWVTRLAKLDPQRRQVMIVLAFVSSSWLKDFQASLLVNGYRPQLSELLQQHLHPLSLQQRDKIDTATCSLHMTDTML